MNGKKIENVPGIIFLDQAVAFANLYNYQLQDRSQKITKNTPINFGKIILPYLIAYICMRNPYSFSENSLSLDTESARITFVAKKFQFSHGNEIPLALSNNILYKILVEEMNLVNQEDFKRAFNCPEFNMGMEIVSSCLCLMYFLPKTYLSSDLDKRIIKYLEVTGGSKRKDIASYFGISDRMMNYYLQSLVASGEIYREGNMTSPYLIYKKTSK
jgi:hypothetical protein